MALTINSTPNRIDNAAAFNVTTSLVEDSTHVNLRVRASIYHEGIVKAVPEKPKGLAAFDFKDILGSLIPGLKFGRDSGDTFKTGSIGANLITSWTTSSGTFDTLTTSGSQIVSAVKGTAVSCFAKTNNITVAPGELYLLYITGLVQTGTPYFRNFTSSGIQRDYSDPCTHNKSILIMPTTAGNMFIELGTTGGLFSIEGYFYLHKITTDRTSVGGALCPYIVKFTEVYEDAAGATQTGASESTQVLRYVQAKGDTNPFASYVLTDLNSLWANKTLKNNACKFYDNFPLNELFLGYFTENVALELFYSKDGAAYSRAIYPNCYEGWGVIILNIGELMATVSSNLRLYLIDAASATTISSVITIYRDGTVISERAVLEFDGDVGGKEYLVFEGIKNIQFSTARNYYIGSGNGKKPLSYKGVNRQLLETRFNDINNTEYLKSLLTSNTVKNLLSGYTATDITVISDSVKISNSELFTNQIEIESEY